jgi:glycosyltransferase involved in cell wall biosynthesis
MRTLRIGINAVFRGQPTGVANYIIHLVNELGRLDSTNQYYVFVVQENRGRFSWGKDNVHEVVCTVDAGRPHAKRLWEFVELPRMVRKLRLDILHCPINVLPPFVSCKRIVTFLDCQYFHESSGNHWLRRAFHHVFMRLSSRWADAMITISASMKKEVSDLLGARADKIHVTLLGQDFSSTPISRDEVASIQRKAGLERPYILFVGFPHYRKNLVRLVKAFDLVRRTAGEIDLVLCGDFHADAESDYPNILRAAREMGIEDRLRRVDYVGRRELQGIITGARVLAFPSLYEGFGLPVIEAMACGTPVLVSDIPVMREIAGDAACYVDPYDIGSIASGMEKVLVDESLRQRLSDRGAELAGGFTWAGTARSTLACYQTLGEGRA